MDYVPNIYSSQLEPVPDRYDAANTLTDVQGRAWGFKGAIPLYKAGLPLLFLLLSCSVIT